MGQIVSTNILICGESKVGKTSFVQMIAQQQQQKTNNENKLQVSTVIQNRGCKAKYFRLYDSQISTGFDLIPQFDNIIYVTTPDRIVQSIQHFSNLIKQKSLNLMILVNKIDLHSKFRTINEVGTLLQQNSFSDVTICVGSVLTWDQRVFDGFQAFILQKQKIVVKEETVLQVATCK